MNPEQPLGARTMKNKNKAVEQVTASAIIRPRLVKATDLAAREAERAAEAVRKVEAKAKAALATPALTRAPRSANEARSMFDALFGGNEAAA